MTLFTCTLITHDTHTYIEMFIASAKCQSRCCAGRCWWWCRARIACRRLDISETEKAARRRRRSSQTPRARGHDLSKLVYNNRVYTRQQHARAFAFATFEMKREGKNANTNGIDNDLFGSSPPLCRRIQWRMLSTLRRTPTPTQRKDCSIMCIVERKVPSACSAPSPHRRHFGHFGTRVKYLVHAGCDKLRADRPQTILAARCVCLAATP